MKNFTNNFKQFTSRLSARWLLMVLMLLLGTGSAWAVDIYITTTATNKINIHTWNNSCGNTSWPGQTIIESPSTNENGGFYIYTCSQDDNYNYILNNGSGGQTGDLTITSTSWGIYNGSNIFTVLMTEANMSSTSITFRSDALSGWSTNTSTTWDATKKKYKTAEVNYSKQSGIDVYIAGTKFIYKASSTFGSPSTGTYIIYWDPYTGNLTFENPCTPSATLSSAVYDAVNNEIDLSGSIAPCGKELFYGFLWKNKDDANWNTANAISGTGGSDNKTTEDIDFNQSWDGFTPGDTYEFTAYALDANTNPYTWYYSTNENDVLEVSTCTSIPDNTYAIAGNNVWTGNANPVTINYDANTYGTPTILYDGEAQIPTDVGTYPITINVPAHNGYCASTISLGDYEITCIDVEKPAITTSATVCAGTPVTLSNYNGDNANTVKWYSNSACAEVVTQQVTPTDGKEYYAKAYHEASGCYSSEYSTLTFTVNPLPIISISSNPTAVLYEDVTLTATGSDIDEVNWTITSGPGTLSNTTGTSVKLTSSTAGTVKVKATATSENDCTKESNELSVIFANETCNNVADMTKIYFDATGNSNFNDNVYLSVAGNTYNTNRSADCNDTSHAADYWPGEDGTFHKMTKIAGTNIYYVDKPASIPSSKISIWNKNQQGNNNVWQAHVILAKSIDNNNNCLVLGSSINHGDRQSYVYCSTWTTYKNAPAITAPAAKTISVSTTDGEGNIIFSGQVVKTGCDATNEYGFQYSSDEQTWTTVKVGENAAAGTVISNNTVNGLDGTYYVRAYITNDNSTQYGAIEEITVSTKKYPITKVTLTHVKNQAGDPYSAQELANLIYCAGETVWFKLEQDGSKFQDYQWISWPGTDLVGMYAAGTFSFTITDSGNVGIRLKNDANDDWVESNLLEFKTHPVAISPTISFENATICSNSTATLKLGALVVDQSYELYKEIENEGVYSEERVGDVTLTCNSIEDDLEFTGLNESGKYFVKGYTAQCPDYKVSSQTATLEIVDASSVYITLNPTEATTTPWMPAKFTVNASDKYTLNVTKGNPAEAATEAEVSQNGNNVSVKIPLPEDATGGEGQYENVSFPQDATTSYIVTAKLVSIGGEDNPCAVPATATITLTPYVEECTEGH